MDTGRLEPIARSLKRRSSLDRAAVEATSALAKAGVASVVLKGPATAACLYPGELRFYSDIDLLVKPLQMREAEAVLARLGYRWRDDTGSTLRNAVWRHATGAERAWRRGDGATVDLHRGYHTLRPGMAWRAVGERSQLLDIAGGQVAVPDSAGTALVVLLHAASSLPIEGASRKNERLNQDLHRALDVIDRTDWEEALRRARAAGVAPQAKLLLAMFGGARGSSLAEQLLADVKPSRLLARSLRSPSRITFQLAIIHQYTLRSIGVRMLVTLVPGLHPRATLRRQMTIVGETSVRKFVSTELRHLLGRNPER